VSGTSEKRKEKLAQKRKKNEANSTNIAFKIF
jgi:hypothetical protein